MIKQRISKQLLVTMLFAFCISIASNAQSFKESRFNKRIYSLNTGIMIESYGLLGFGGGISHLKTIGKHFYTHQALLSGILNESPDNGADHTLYNNNKELTIGYNGRNFESNSFMQLQCGFGYSPFRIDRRFFSFQLDCALMYRNSIYLYDELNQAESTYYLADVKEVVVQPVFSLNYHTQIKPCLYLNYKLALGSDSAMFAIGIGFDSKQYKRRK